MELNLRNPTALDCWGIAVATNIVFVLGLLNTFGSRPPVPLRVFSLTFTTFYDLAAISNVAIFYSGGLSLHVLWIGVRVLIVTLTMNRLVVTRVAAYTFVGVIPGIAMLKSGVHATVAGVLIAFCVPLKDSESRSPLREHERRLHVPVT